MKRKLFTSVIFIGILILIYSNPVYASLSNLGSGYAVTSNAEGVIVESGTPITVTAVTLDPNVSYVSFRWFGPPDGTGELLLDETIPIFRNGTMGKWNNGEESEIGYAESSFWGIHGEMKVQVLFHDAMGSNCLADFSETVMLRKTLKLLVVPEIPLGTIAAMVTMALALFSFFIMKRRQ